MAPEFSGAIFLEQVWKTKCMVLHSPGVAPIAKFCHPEEGDPIEGLANTTIQIQVKDRNFSFIYPQSSRLRSVTKVAGK